MGREADGMGYMELENGTEVYYRIGGEGSPLVCIHGFGADSSAFRLTEKILSRDFMVVTLDLPGHGRTKGGPRPVTIEKMGRSLDEFINKLGLRGINLLGWSMGGSVAMEYIKSAGDCNLRSLVLVETSPKLVNEEDWKGGLFRGDYTRKMAEGDLGRIREKYDLFSEEFMRKMAPGLDKENLDIAIGGMKKNSPEVMAEVWESMILSDLRDLPGKVSVPSLVISGQESTFYGPESGIEMAGMFREGRHLAIRGGHLCPVENPVQFNRVVKDFVSNGVFR